MVSVCAAVCQKKRRRKQARIKSRITKRVEKMRKRLRKCFPSVCSHHPDHAPGPRPLHILVYVHTEGLAHGMHGGITGLFGVHASPV